MSEFNFDDLVPPEDPGGTDPGCLDLPEVVEPLDPGIEHTPAADDVLPLTDPLEPTDLDSGLLDDTDALPEELDADLSVAPGQEGLFLFDEDMSCWCEPGLPEDWESWEAPVEPDPESWTDMGYSTDWGTVEPAWCQGGEDPFSVVAPEEPLSNLVGPGHSADVFWADQGQTNYCALYSVRAVLSELYGVQVDPGEVVQRAATNGWLLYDENGEAIGVRPEDVDDIFASYGVPSHNSTGEEGAWQALNDALANDERVVLALDSKEVDASANVGDELGALDMDHAVAVTGIDYDRGVVIVNDSARGAGLEIPMNVFYESWRDSDFAMTVTDVDMPGGEAAMAPAGATTFISDAPGLSTLNMTLHPSLASGAMDDLSTGSAGTGTTDLNMLALEFAGARAEEIMSRAGEPGFFASLPSMAGGTGALLDNATGVMEGAAADAKAIVGEDTWHDVYLFNAQGDPWGLKEGLEDPLEYKQRIQANWDIA